MEWESGGRFEVCVVVGWMNSRLGFCVESIRCDMAISDTLQLSRQLCTVQENLLEVVKFLEKSGWAASKFVMFYKFKQKVVSIVMSG